MSKLCAKCEAIVEKLIRDIEAVDTSRGPKGLARFGSAGAGLTQDYVVGLLRERLELKKDG